MGHLLSYSLLSGLCLLLLFATYRIFLSQENQPRYNRIILLAIYAVSFSVIPLMQLLRELSLSTDVAPGAIGEVSARAIAAVAEPASGPNATPLIWIYMAGMAVAAAGTLKTWLTLIRMVRSGHRLKISGLTIVITDREGIAPFSWLNRIVISRSDYEGPDSAIVIHERAHVARRHWADLLIAQIVCIFNWFNPAAWLMRDELMLVHEYQADMAVIEHGSDPREYQMLLIKKAVGARFPSLANSLNHSKLKKRITMMYKAKSGVGSRLKALTLAPALMLALAIASIPAVSAAATAIGHSGISIGKGSENLPQNETLAKNFKVKAIINKGIMTTVVIEGNNLGNSLSTGEATLSNALVTYQATAMQTDMIDGAAIIKADFPVAGQYDGTEVSITCNGERLTFPLDGVEVEKAPIGSSQASAGGEPKINAYINSPGALPGYRIFVDGKEIDPSSLEKFDNDDIESVTVNRPDMTMIITLKK